MYQQYLSLLNTKDNKVLHQNYCLPFNIMYASITTDDTGLELVAALIS